MMSLEGKTEKKKKRHTQEVIYNIKRDSDQTQRTVKRKTNKKKESGRYILGGYYYLIHRNLYL